jgi:hypothetical protein
MTADKTKNEIAALRAEVEALKAAQPKPQPSREEQERATAEWIDKMHQMREGRMNAVTPPSALRDLVAAEPKGFMAGVVRDNRNAPTSPTGMIPNSGRGAGAPVPSSPTPGWVDPTPLRPPEGIHWVDTQLIADEVRQRAELKRKLGG